MEVKFECNGDDLAKILWYYGLIENVNCTEQKILCPFHEDANPSMIANFKTGSYFCFGCQEAGDALKFVQTVEKRNGLNDLQSCKKYFEILKSKSIQALNIKRHDKVKESNSQLYREAYDYYHGLSKVDWRNSEASESIEIKETMKYMANRGFDQNTLNKCLAKVTYNKSYQIIFPMLDNGKFKGWVCRTTDKEIEKQRKYLYNKGFRRKNSLIGKYDDCEILFIVEGYMDRLKFVQFGIDNVVAILGWKISDIQIQNIKNQNKIKYIVSALDNDECGKKGSRYLQSIFKERYIRFSYIKNIKDPGEMNEKNFKKMLRKTLEKINTQDTI